MTAADAAGGNEFGLTASRPRRRCVTDAVLRLRAHGRRLTVNCVTARNGLLQTAIRRMKDVAGIFRLFKFAENIDPDGTIPTELNPIAQAQTVGLQLSTG
jgi:hypothetical protein